MPKVTRSNKTTGKSLSFFKDHGYVVLKELFTPQEIRPISDEIDGIIEGRVSYMPESDLAYESGSSRRVRNAFRLTQNNPFFLEVARYPKIVSTMEGLLGFPLRLYSSQLFAKPPHVGSAVPLHQDIAYWPFEPPELISCWIALDDSSIANGCVRFIDGSHRLGRLRHVASGVVGNSLVLDDPRIVGFEESCVQVARGSVVLHHCLTAHRSESNRSDSPRRGLIMIYMSAAVRPTDPAMFGNNPDFPLISQGG